MKKNLGSSDRIIRIVIAVLFVALYASGLTGGVAGIVLLVLAGTLVLTSMVGFCPLYLPFGLNTLRKKIQVK